MGALTLCQTHDHTAHQHTMMVRGPVPGEGHVEEGPPKAGDDSGRPGAVTPEVHSYKKNALSKAQDCPDSVRDRQTEKWKSRKS